MIVLINWCQQDQKIFDTKNLAAKKFKKQISVKELAYSLHIIIRHNTKIISTNVEKNKQIS